MTQLKTLNNRGFSLLEVVVACLLVGTMYSIIVGTWWDWGRMHLRQEARHLATDLRWARSRAIQTRKNHVIKLDLERDRYAVKVEQEGNYSVLLDRKMEGGINLEDFSLAQPAFHFTPTGAPSRGNTITLGEEKALARVITRVGTGRVRINMEKRRE